VKMKWIFAFSAVSVALICLIWGVPILTSGQKGADSGMGGLLYQGGHSSSPGEAELAGQIYDEEISGVRSAPPVNGMRLEVASGGGYLPTERSFMKDNAISVDAVSEVIHDEGFAKVLDKLGDEAATDPDSSDLQRMYTSAINKALASHPSLRLVDLSCGMTLCMGVIQGRGSSEAEYVAWRASMAQSEPAPIYSFIDGILNIADERADYRFFFSTDPGAPALHALSRPLVD
jgi:hypothetical protein